MCCASRFCLCLNRGKVPELAEQMFVCETCRRALRGDAPIISKAPDSTVFVHHQTLKSLKTAALETRCYFCLELWSGFSHEQQQTVVRACEDCDVTNADVASHVARSDVSRIRIDEYRVQGRRFKLYLSFDSDFIIRNSATGDDGHRFFNLQTPHDLGKTVIQTPCGYSTGSNEALNQAMSWLQACAREHEDCKRDRGREPYCPTRLIDVGNTGEPSVRLVLEARLLGEVCYVTLSHCWGNASFFRLTTQSEKELQAGVHISVLPQTFQDAVAVCRYLNVRYLWIDSLCIFQDPDDLSDWLRESAMMHSVYSHGLFNISATAARTGADGLFVKRDPYEFPESELEVFVKEAGTQSDETQAYVSMDTLFWERNVVVAPVNQRGWVLQERLLSNRVLHFGHSQLLWECRTLDAAEIYPKGLPEVLKARAVPFENPRRLTATAQAKDLQISVEDAYQGWRRIVMMYTPTLLSNGGDKLIAISGLAKDMAAITQADYVAGMWRQFLPGQLLWHTQSEHRQQQQRRKPKPSIYRAPSWSWACVDHYVFYNKTPDRGIRFQVERVALEYKSEDTFGVVTGGHIILKGTLMRLHLHPELNPASRSTYIDSILSINGQFLTLSDNCPAAQHIHLDFEPTNDLSLSNANGSLFGLEGEFAKNVLTILLLRVEDEKRGVFSRIGIAILIFDQTDITIGDVIERDQHEPNLPSLHWDKQTRTHTICVI